MIMDNKKIFCLIVFSLFFIGLFSGVVEAGPKTPGEVWDVTSGWLKGLFDLNKTVQLGGMSGDSLTWGMALVMTVILFLVLLLVSSRVDVLRSFAEERKWSFTILGLIVSFSLVVFAGLGGILVPLFEWVGIFGGILGYIAIFGGGGLIIYMLVAGLGKKFGDVGLNVAKARESAGKQSQAIREAHTERVLASQEKSTIRGLRSAIKKRDVAKINSYIAKLGENLESQEKVLEKMRDNIQQLKRVGLTGYRGKDWDEFEKEADGALGAIVTAHDKLRKVKDTEELSNILDEISRQRAIIEKVSKVIEKRRPS